MSKSYNLNIIVCTCIFLLFPAESIHAQDINQDLIAYYPFYGNATDESGNGNNGDVNGAELIEINLGWNFWGINEGYFFNDVQDYINLGGNINPGEIATFSIWFKADDLHDWSTLIQKYTSDTQPAGNLPNNTMQKRSYRIKFLNQKLRVTVSPILHPSNQAVTVESNMTFNTHQWYHIVVTINSEATQIYVNGELDQIGQGVPQIASSGLPTIIGNGNYIYQSTNQSNFNGTIDNVRIYNRVLTEDEIKCINKYELGVFRSPQELPQSTANVSEDFEDFNFCSWTFNDPDDWEVENGVLQMRQAGELYRSWLRYFAKMDAAEIAGDFTLTMDIGFNEDAYIMESENVFESWGIYYRNIFFGIMQDGCNTLLASMRGSGPDNGIYKYNNCVRTNLFDMFSGHWNDVGGLGLDIHDMRAVKMSRKGNVISVWADGKLLYQASDNTNDPINAGWVVIGIRGSTGIKIDNVRLEPYADDPPVFNGIPVKTDFTFDLNEGAGHLITSEEGYWGTLEGESSIPGSFMGWWIDDGVSIGNKSWAAAAGQLLVHNYTFTPKATLEEWFKCVKKSAPLFAIMFNGQKINENWGRERGGLFYSVNQDGTTDLALRLQGIVILSKTKPYSFDIENFRLDMPNVIELNDWTHVAWVRDNTLHTIYVNGIEVGSMEMSRWGETPLTEVQLSVGNSADHDFAREIGSPPYFYIDQFRVTSASLRPIDFQIASGLLAQAIKYSQVIEFDGFDKLSHKGALLEKLKDLELEIDKINPNVALARLENIKKRMEKWITSAEDLQNVLTMMDRLINYFENQDAPGNGKDKTLLSSVARSNISSLPKKIQLMQNHPNPFNPSTTISYLVPDGNQELVTLKVYDLRGRLVRTLVEGIRGAGTYSVYWDGTDESGRQVSSGVYLYRMQAGEFTQTRKMVILK